MVETPGQTVRISLDGQNNDVTPVLSLQPAWTSERLDPNVPHDLQVIKQNPAGQYLALHSVLVTYNGPPTISREQTTTEATPVPTITSQPTSSASSGSRLKLRRTNQKGNRDLPQLPRWELLEPLSALYVSDFWEHLGFTSGGSGTTLR
jgi:hypothetical protein